MNTPPEYLFECSDGCLYDTRKLDWANHPLRTEYSVHFSIIKTGRKLRAALRAGPYAWPGGYALAFYTDGGDIMCHSCVKENLYREIAYIREEYSNSISYHGIVGEECVEFCADCGKQFGEELE